MFTRSTRGWLASATAALLLAGTITGTAHAVDMQSGTIATTLSATANLGTQSESVSDGAFSASAAFSSDLDWSETGDIKIGWDGDQMRQGRDLDPTYQFVPGSAFLEVVYSGQLTGTVRAFDTDISVNLPMSITTSGTCLPGPDGQFGTCTVSSSAIEIEPCPGLSDSSVCPLSPRFKFTLESVVDVGALASATTRTATSGGLSVAPNAALSPTVSSQVDAMKLACTVPAGDQLRYALGDVTGGRHFAVATKLRFAAEISEPVTPIPGIFPYVTIFSKSFPLGSSSADAGLAGNGGLANLGVIGPNNIAPTLSVAPSFAGPEGSAVAFGATATGPCADGGAYVWRFSDGSREFGANVSKTFADSGSYSGQVTITDVTGLAATKSFAVQVSNVAPSVTVTPTSPAIAWGRDLTLAAQAVDPGSADQSTLTYRWTFGDGTEVTDGGSSESHRWASPGSYPTSVRVCDKDGGCTTVDLAVTVNARATTTSYTGDNHADHSATATLSASVVDEFGNAVPGAAVAFSLGGSAAGSASTGADGKAARSHVVSLTSGDHAVSAAYSGSTLYTASASVTESFRVAAMASDLTYTGALSSKQNAVTPVSAKLVDALGRPISGQTITFKLASKTTTAVTNAQGVATSSVTMKEKPGTYQVEVSWTGIAGRYVGDTWSGAIKHGTK